MNGEIKTVADHEAPPKNSLEDWSKRANLVVACITIATFWLLYYQHQILNRPYLGLGDDITVDRGTVYSSTAPNGARVDLGMRIQVTLKNYGNRPSSFRAEVLGWSSPIIPYQTSNSYIMPNQQIPLIWDLMFPDKTDDLCGLDKSISIKIEYDNYLFVLRPTYINNLELGPRKAGDFKVRRTGCSTESDAHEVRVWYVERST